MRKRILLSALNYITRNQHDIILVNMNEIMADVMLENLSIDIPNKPVCFIDDKQSWHKQNRGRISKRARR